MLAQSFPVETSNVLRLVSKTSKVFARNTSQMFPLVRRTNSGVHMAAKRTWNVRGHCAKEPPGGANLKWGRKGNRAN